MPRHYFQCNVVISVYLVGILENETHCCFTLGVVIRPTCPCHPCPSSNTYVSFIIHLHTKRHCSLLKDGNLKNTMLESRWSVGPNSTETCHLLAITRLILPMRALLFSFPTFDSWCLLWQLSNYYFLLQVCLGISFWTYFLILTSGRLLVALARCTLTSFPSNFFLCFNVYATWNWIQYLTHLSYFQYGVLVTHKVWCSNELRTSVSHPVYGWLLWVMVLFCIIHEETLICQSFCAVSFA